MKTFRTSQDNVPEEFFSYRPQIAEDPAGFHQMGADFSPGQK